MTKIEEIEKLIKRWEANIKKKRWFGLPRADFEISFLLDGLELALEIFKRPSNTQMQIDIATWQNAKFMCMRCGWLLTEGSAEYCPRCD